MRKRLVHINKILNSTWYDLELSDDEFRHLEQQMHNRSLERNEGDGRLRLHDRSLYRVFNSASFDKGGRFYGGWWQIIPSSYRRKILINGKRTVELDFSSLHPSILYAKIGKELPTDAYDISLKPSLAKDEHRKLSYRKLVKKAFNAMINAEHPLKQPPREIALKD